MRLETSIKRYIGSSTEQKPFPGLTVEGVEVKAGDLPPGSSFLEEDTGRIYRWTGGSWAAPPLSDPATDLISTVLVEVRALRKEIRTGLPVETTGL